MSFTKPPLPFIGNKSPWKNEFKQVIKEYIAKGVKIFVDVFGGSGYCSCMIKQCINELGLNINDYTIIYNDFDNYSERINNYEYNYKIKCEICDLIKSTNTRHHEKLPDNICDKISKTLIEYNKTKPVDMCYISQSFIHQMDSYRNFDKMMKDKRFYNNTSQKRVEHIDNINEYLEHMQIVHLDCMECLEKYNDVDNTCYILDPPYLNDFRESYTEYDVDKLFRLLYYILKKFNYFIYFTSDKSFIPKLLKNNDSLLTTMFDEGIRHKILSLSYHKKRHHVICSGYYIDYMFYA